MAAEMEPKYGADVIDPPLSVDPVADLAAYAGVYTADVFGSLEITIDGDQLMMTLGPEQRQFPLTHYTRDVFTYEPTGENAGRASAVTFTIPADGLASQVIVDNLNLYGAGTFLRT